MKILVLGGSGMLGHRLWIHLQKQHQVWVTIRGEVDSIPNVSEFPRENIRTDVDGRAFDQVTRALAAIQPDLIINCIGLIKQLGYIARDPLFSIYVNALLPHQVSLICRAANIRLIHISTDCVFSGIKGNYSEDDFADGNDVYGRTKYLGEVRYPHCITLRTSIIGREIKGYYGLIEWFLRQENEVKGFTKAIFSGLTTDEFSKVISDFVIPNQSLSGIFHVSGPPVSKFDLLNIVKDAYGKDIKINPSEEIRIDRSLNASRFIEKTGYSPPSWIDMIKQMKITEPFYEKIKRLSDQ